MHSQGTPEYIPLPDGRRLYAQVLPPAAESGITVVFEGGGASRLPLAPAPLFTTAPAWFWPTPPNMQQMQQAPPGN